jgi:hypothetical protein
MGHCCSNCGKEMHIVGGGCCAQFELDKRIQVCAMCKYPAIEVEEDVETPASIPRKQPKLQLLMSHDMLLESDVLISSLAGLPLTTYWTSESTLAIALIILHRSSITSLDLCT